jgi:hypothetical protein
MSTDARWASAYSQTFNGGPWGLGAWLQAAQGHNKKLAVSEWAIWQRSNQTAAQADDPVYVDHMYRLFDANTGSIAHESYLNAPGGHALCPSTSYPNAAAKYRADWQQPAAPPAAARAKARTRQGAR